MSDRNPTSTMSWTDSRGKEQVRTVRHLIDIRDFVGTPGYPLLLIAANTHLAVSDIERLLDDLSREVRFVYRPPTWIQKRRWLFQLAGTANQQGARPNRDGKDATAVEFMRANPDLSVRNLTLLLKERGIIRGREWVRKYRCDPVY